MSGKFLTQKFKIGNLSLVFYLISVAVLAVIYAIKSKPENTQGLKIGMAEVNYTPAVGLDLVGNYRGVDYASRGIHDPLYARAVVIEDHKGVRVALLTVDICKLAKVAVSYMRSYASAGTGIQAGNIMIHATHTHSGPPGDLDAPQAREYLTKAASAIIIANENLRPGNLSIGYSYENGISFNRRLKYKDDKTHMSWEHLSPDSVIKPLGPIDPELITLWIEQEGNLTGNIVNFGCHPATLTGSNWQYSADYPGFISKSFKKIYGEEFASMFFNGCSGNVTQVNYKVGFVDTYEECSRIGNVLGAGSQKTESTRTKIEANSIAVSSELIPLKRITITEEQYQWARQIMKKVESEGMPPLQQDGIPDAQFAVQWIELYKVQEKIDSLEVMVVSIGDVAFVGLPGEMFSEFGIDIKNRSPFSHTIVMGLTNDAKKYFPTEVSFTQGPAGCTPMITGYETTPGATLYDPGSGERLAESAISQLEMIFGI